MRSLTLYSFTFIAIVIISVCGQHTAESENCLRGWKILKNKLYLCRKMSKIIAIKITEIMKRIALIGTLILSTLLCLGQKEHLEPVKEINTNGTSYYSIKRKEYYENIFSLLYSGFWQKPYARYTCLPSFLAEYSFSVEKIKGNNYIISNKLSTDYWSASSRKDVKVYTHRVKIKDDLYLKIGELFELLTEQTKEKERKFVTLPNGEIAEEIVAILDGASYYFTTTDQYRVLKTGTTRLGKNVSLLRRLVKICDNLFSIGTTKKISQAEILKEINALLNDFKLTNN